MKKTNRYPYRKNFLDCLLILTLLAGLTSCKKYLDAKPDKTLAVPSTLQDFQAIIDNNTNNQLYPFAGDMACDNYFIKAADLSAFPIDDQRTYQWNANAANDLDWNYAYTLIERFNVILDGIDQVNVQGASSLSTQANIKGSALFFRAYMFDQVANVFALPYDAKNSTSLPGIPLRLSSDINALTTRSTMEATYQQIIADLKSAANLLPLQPLIKTRPCRPAAYGTLARICLEMGDYTHANQYADSCLQLYSKLMDYNTLDSTKTNPIAIFNDEVIYHGTSSGGDGVYNPFYARVDTALYASYAKGDLRKPMFYTTAGDGYYSFRGDYTGQSFGQPFNGIAVDEILLIRAESNARLGNTVKAINDLNLLLSNRYAKAGFSPYPQNSADPLSLILQERRKELAFRSELRWSDLRRLNTDIRFAKTLTRNIGGTIYTLAPNDNRYAFLIPVSVIQQTGIAQNTR